MNNKILGLVIVSVLFAVSVFIRRPFLGDPLAYHHEWITASTLIALENLDVQGALKHKFRIIQTYPNDADRYISWITTRTMDTNGVGYYTTYPPFSIILLYGMLKLLGLAFSTLNVQGINLFLHFVGVVYMFALMYDMAKANRLIAGVVSAGYYIFLYPNLWFFSTTVSWDIFWHHFVVIELFILYRILQKILRGEPTGTMVLVALGFVNFITTYTEYQGFLFAVLVGAFCAYMLRKNIEYARVLVSLLVSSALTLLLIAYQYGSIAGVPALIRLMWNKLFIEYGTFGACILECSPIVTLSHYMKLFSPAILPFVFLAAALVWTKRGLTGRRIESSHVILILPLLMMVIHHVLMFQDVATHEFTTLKFSIFVSLLFGTGISLLSLEKYSHKTIGYIALLLIGTSWYFSVALYLANYPKKSESDVYMKLGQAMRAQSSTDEVLFAITPEVINPQTVYYAKRNIQTVDSIGDALRWLRVHKKTKGKVFVLVPDYQIAHVTPLSISE